MLGLHCCLQAASSCGEWVPSLGASHGLLCRGFPCCGARALRQERFSSCGSQDLGHRLNSCGSRAQLPGSTWDHPRSGIEPVSPAWAGAFFTTEPPGKPPFILGRGSLEFYNEIFRRIKKEPAFWSKTKTRNA